MTKVTQDPKTFRFKLPKNSSNQVSSVLVSLMQRDFRKQQNEFLLSNIKEWKHQHWVQKQKRKLRTKSFKETVQNPHKTQFVQLPEKIKLVEETVIFPPTARKQLEGFEGGRVTSFDQADSRRKVDPHGQFLEGFGEPISTVFNSCPVC